MFQYQDVDGTPYPKNDRVEAKICPATVLMMSNKPRLQPLKRSASPKETIAANSISWPGHAAVVQAFEKKGVSGNSDDFPGSIRVFEFTHEVHKIIGEAAIFNGMVTQSDASEYVDQLMEKCGLDPVEPSHRLLFSSKMPCVPNLVFGNRAAANGPAMRTTLRVSLCITYNLECDRMVLDRM